MADIDAILRAASTGMRAQTSRMRVAAENVANASTTGATPGEDPYRRRMPTFEAELDRELGVRVVKVAAARDDMSAFRMKYEPGHPAADEKGYVKYPNVDSLVESMDIREASRAYEANLSLVDAARSMASRALDLIRR